MNNPVATPPITNNGSESTESTHSEQQKVGMNSENYPRGCVGRFPIFRQRSTGSSPRTIRTGANPMVGTTLIEIRQHIESLSLTDGEYHVRYFPTDLRAGAKA